MTNIYRYIAFSMIDGNALACGPSAAEALQGAVAFHSLPDGDFIEVLDCGETAGASFNGGPLHQARKTRHTSYRGAGYAETHPPVALEPHGSDVVDTSVEG